MTAATQIVHRVEFSSIAKDKDRFSGHEILGGKHTYTSILLLYTSERYLLIPSYCSDIFILNDLTVNVI